MESKIKVVFSMILASLVPQSKHRAGI